MTHAPADMLEDFARDFIRAQDARDAACAVDVVLVATDFSSCSLRALDWGEQIARTYGAELVLLHVDEVLALFPESKLAEARRTSAERALERTVQRLRERGVRVRGLLRPGAPQEEIPRSAEAERASLVVMGTHGRHGLAHVLLGSVAEQVVQSAPCPVLTVHPGGTPTG